MISFRTLLIGLVVAAFGCKSADETANVSSAVVHDVDDRLDVYEYPDLALATQARSSVVALVHHTRLIENGAGYDLVGGELGEALNLCQDERFADQPTLAFCSGTLVDDDLVLTAGHCILPQGIYGTSDCTTTRFVFDFFMQSESALEPIDLDDVYGCRSVVAHWLDSSVDYALVQLDRPVVGRTPAPVRRLSGPVPLGSEVTEIGFPTGMPMKIDDGGLVIDPGPASLDYFVTSLDSFRGNSGSGVLDSSGSVIGVLARTSERDYVYDSDSRCYRVVVEPELRGSLASTYVERALEDLCGGQAYPSQRLCGVAPACNDGFCTADEPESCPSDCPAPICGDGICEPADDETSCPYDCGATVQAGVYWSGCSAAPGARGGPLSAAWLLLAGVFLLRARRRLRRGAASIGVALLLCSTPSGASAQARIHPWGLRFVGTVDGHRDRGTLTNDVDEFGELHATGYGLGLRIGADMGLGRWSGVEAAAAARGVGGFGNGSIELSLAPRLRVVMRPRHELYLRAPIGAAWQTIYDDAIASLLVGAGAGYRWQLTRVVDAFVELEFDARLGGPMDPYAAYSLGYGLHPSSPPDLRTTSFLVRLGIGLGRGYRPRCER